MYILGAAHIEGKKKSENKTQCECCGEKFLTKKFPYTLLLFMGIISLVAIHAVIKSFGHIVKFSLKSP